MCMTMKDYDMDQLMVTIPLDEYRDLIEKVTRYELLE